MLPPTWRPSATTLPQELIGLMLLTVHPDHVASPVLSLVETIIAVGEAPERSLQKFSAALEQAGADPATDERPLPAIEPTKLEPGEAPQPGALLYVLAADGNTLKVSAKRPA